MGEDFVEVISKDRYAKIGYGTTKPAARRAPLRRDRRQDRVHDCGGLLLITGAKFENREVVMAFLGPTAS